MPIPPLRMPMLDQPQGYGLAPQLQPLTDEQQAQAALEAINQQIQGLGQAPEQMGPPGFLERLFNSGAGEGLNPPHNFLSGLLQGATQGLASRGQKVAQKRQQVEALIEQQRQAKNQQQLKDLEAQRAAALSDVYKVKEEGRKATAEQEKLAGTSTVVTPEMAKANPGLSAIVGKSIPNSVIASAAYRPSREGSQADAEIPKSVAQAIISGKQAPDLSGLYRYGAATRAELAKAGYDLAGAQKDWKAVTRQIATLNGPQQTRLRQAVETAYDSLDVIDNLSSDLTKELKSFRTPVNVFNRGVMIAARNGAYGPKAKDLATQLEAQIGDVSSEIGNAYMGGNSPTDHALSLAQKNLNSNWDERTLAGATKLARTNLQIRRNSIYNSEPIVPGQAPPPMGMRPRPTRIPVITPDGTFYFDNEDDAKAFADEAFSGS